MLLGGASTHGDAKKRSYQFRLVNVRVWNHIYRKQINGSTDHVQTCFIWSFPCANLFYLDIFIPKLD